MSRLLLLPGLHVAALQLLQLLCVLLHSALQLCISTVLERLQLGCMRCCQGC